MPTNAAAIVNVMPVPAGSTHVLLYPSRMPGGYREHPVTEDNTIRAEIPAGRTPAFVASTTDRVGIYNEARDLIWQGGPYPASDGPRIIRFERSTQSA